MVAGGLLGIEGGSRKANKGLLGSASVDSVKVLEPGEQTGVSMEKWEEVEGM